MRGLKTNAELLLYARKDKRWQSVFIVGTNGITRKQDFLPLIESGNVTHETMQIVSEARTQIYSDTAVLTGRVTNNGHFKGQPFSADEWATAVFWRCERRWLCVLSHGTSAET